MRVVGTSQGVAPAPAAQDLQLFAITVPERSAHAKLLVGMNEVVGRQVGKTEKQVRDRPECRGLSRLIGAIDQMQAFAGRRKDPARRR